MKAFILFVSFVSISFFCAAQNSGDYQTVASVTGNWNGATTWEVHNGTSFVATSTPPSSTNGVITIRTGATITINSAITIDQTVVQTGATLTQSHLVTLADGTGDDLLINGNWNWGTIALSGPGTVKIGSTGVATLDPPSPFSRDLSVNIINDGTYNWNSGDMRYTANATFTNNGTLNLNGVTTLVNNGGTCAFINNGTINENAAGSFHNFDAFSTFDNTGTINFNAGEYRNRSGIFTNTGNLNFNGGIFINSAILNLNTGSTLTGTGTFTNTGGGVFLNINTNQTIPSTIVFTNNVNLVIAAATTFTVNGTWNATGSTLRGDGTAIVGSTGVLNMPSSVGANRIAANLTNNGTFNWNGGPLFFSTASSTLTNNGVWNINLDNALNVESGNGTVLNNGTIIKNSTGEVFIGINNFTNSSSGIIKGVGTYKMNSVFSNDGTFAPGASPGVVTFNISQPLSANSTLQIEILDGSGVGTGHDQLVRNGNLILAGTLTVTETGTVPNGAYTIINLTGASTISGSFASVNLPAGYSIQTTSTTVTVTRSVVPPTPQQKPGSGNAISFDGADDFVDIPSATNLNFGTAQDFVVETWVKIPVSQNFTGSSDNIIIDKWGGFGSGSAYPFSIRLQNATSPDANKISVFRTNDIGGGAGINSLSTMNDNKWHHIAFAKNGTVLSLYIDGVLNGTITDIATGNTGNNATVTIGRRNGATQQAFFTGSIDEVRFWNTGLTQAQIRDRMCRKITAADALFANLVSYYNFDESSGNIAFDGIAFAGNGTLTNGPTRETSGAAIGTISAHSYAGAASSLNLINTSRNDDLSVTLTAGTAAGLQMYCVTEAPNTTSGQAAIPGNIGYFGVFPIGGTGNQYSAAYNYDGIANIVNENGVRLYKRNDNAGTSWTNALATLNTSANELTVTGQNTEYMVGEIALPTEQEKPGSGNALSFDGVDDFTEVPHNTNINFSLSDNFSISFWLKIPSANQPDAAFQDNIIIEKWSAAGTGPYPFAIRYFNHTSSDNGKIGFNIYNGTSLQSVLSNITLNDDKLHHIVCTKASGQLSIFIDGLNVSGTNTGTVNTGTINNNDNLYFGSRGGVSNYFKGSLDEVRFWNTNLSLAQMRDRMCRKITSTDALIGNLVGSYKLDESTGNTIFDGTVNGNNGTISNSLTRETSAAPIGNVSSHFYQMGNLAFNFTNPLRGDKLFVSETGPFNNNTHGIHIYCVTQSPNTSSGVVGVGNNNNYFGVFRANVNEATNAYDAVYDYTGIAGIANESDLRLYKRNDNSGTVWVDAVATLSTGTNTLAVTGQHTEYMVGSVGRALPLDLISFSGSKQNNNSHLQWRTANEVNVSHFELQRSDDGQNFTTIGNVQPGGAIYSYTDANVFLNKSVVFYRLKSVDTDGKFTYSSVVRLTAKQEVTVNVFPNPIYSSVIVSGLKQKGTIRLLNAEGKLLQQQTVTSQSVIFNMSNYASGMYILQYFNGVEVVNQKIVKQ